MSGTITDDKSAIAQTSGVELQRHRARFENLAEFRANKSQPQAFTPKLVNYDWTENRFTDKIRHLFFSTNSSFAVALLRRMEEGFLRKLGIGGLAFLLLVCLSVRVDAGFVNLDCTYPTYFNCRDASWFPDSDGSISSHECHVRNRHLKTGDYLDKLWYRYLDKEQYYYLDKVQYKLLGGANYILGHPCYPKLFERRSEEAVGFTNRGGIYIPWYDYNWDYLTINNPDSLDSCFKTGDNIEKWRYRYLDKGLYYALDETQYTWLGGLAYEFETPCSGIWHISGPLHSYDYHCLLKSFTKGDIIAYKSSVPEPATIGLLGLGTWGILIFRNKRRTKK